MLRRFQTIDVFTDTKLAGNPLAVILDSEGLDGDAMQRIAREFNISETVFCAAPRDPVNTASLRIFTPATELPFAGHPTIGTAIVLATHQAPDLLAREEISVVLEEPIGPVACAVRHRRGEPAHARFEVPQLAEETGEAESVDILAARLGLTQAEIGFAGHRPRRCPAGNPMTFVPLASHEALARATLRAGEKDMLYLYTPAEPEAARTFRCRMLASGYGVAEDPATGSAAAAFPAVLHANEQLGDGDHDCVLLQGIEMGRPSRMGVAYAIADGRLVSTAVGGSAVLVMQGMLDV